MKKSLLIASFVLSNFIIYSQEYHQILTNKSCVVDTLHHEYIIEDCYRWLEKVNSLETKEWIRVQNKSSKKYLSKIPKRHKILKLIKKCGETNYTIPKRRKKYYFTYGIYNDISTPVIMFKGSGQVDYRVLIDPDDISQADNISINSIVRSKNEAYLLYLYSRNGSDKEEAGIISMESKMPLPDYLDNIMFSNIEWYKDGFFYSSFENQNEFGVTNGQRIMYHKVETGQYKDQLIFERKSHPNNTFEFQITHDDKFLVLTEKFSGKDKTNIFYIDLEEEDFKIKPLLTNLALDINIIDSYKGNIVASTKLGTSSGAIFKINLESPYDWEPLSHNYSGEVLSNVLLLKEHIATIYQADQPILNILDYQKNLLYSLELPKGTSASIRSTGRDRDYIYFYFTSYTIPPVVYKLNLVSFKKELIKKTSVTFDFNEIVLRDTTYLSNDGEKIPITIVHKKDIILDGNNPTLLSAYGGFGHISSPSFDPGIVNFVEHGGVYAFTHIRGGGEKGTNWAKSGSGNNKQQSFDDFIAGAEYLIENKYTSSTKLAATGASNGGLVVAAAGIQRPDLFKAIVPRVAPLDMLRYEKFTVGHRWVSEYGTVSDSLSFTHILNYTPYQNIKEDVNYPTMLIITSSNDDRVPPFHSYKFAAALQSRKAQTNPILLKIEKMAGHDGALTKKKSYQEELDLYAFIMNALNMKY